MLAEALDGAVLQVAVFTLLFLLTYFVHSSLIIGLSLVATRLHLVKSQALKDVLLKAALIGGIVTMSTQTFLKTDSLSGRWDLPRPARNIESPGPVLGSRNPAGGNDLEVKITAEEFAKSGPSGLRESQGTTAEANKPNPDQEPQTGQKVGRDGNWRLVGVLKRNWPVLAIVFWLAGVFVSILRFGTSKIKLHRRLRSRRNVTNSRLTETLTDMSGAVKSISTPRLTCSEQLVSPIVVSSREICLPERALTNLSREQQTSMLAHELAHIVRRDLFWLRVCQAFEIAFFFQPLNVLVRRDLQEVAEFLSDDWAVHNTGEPLSLAKCLAEVASWIQSRPLPMQVVGMAQVRSPLLQRVQRVLNNSTPTPRIPRFLQGVSVLGILLLTLGVAPHLGLERPERPVFELDRRRNSISADIFTTEKHGVYELRVDWKESYDHRMISAKARGEFSFSDNDRRILYVSHNGYLWLHEAHDETSRRMDIRGKRFGGPEFEFRENGEKRPIDDAARKWFEGMLVEFIREVNLYDEHRAWRILEQHGPDELLAEIQKTRNAGVQRSYKRALEEFKRSGLRDNQR